MALIHVNFASKVLQTNMEMDVILPEDAEKLIGMAGGAGEGAYPVLYLLHGMSDDHSIWQRRTSIERYASEKGLAVVMPTTYLGWYTDMAKGPKYFTFLTEELPKICRDLFPGMSKKREDTFAAGLSMGGFGALKCGLRAYNVFSCVASLSGAVDEMENFRDINLGEDGASYWTSIFGSPEKAIGSFDDLYSAAEDVPKELRPRVYMWCGTEDFLFAQNERMNKRLRSLGYDLTYETSKGDHQWKYWDEKIKTVIEWLPLDKEAK